MPQTLKQDFPKSESKVRQLVSDHLKLTDEPLLLAIYYAPDREPGDIFLFELIKGFGAGSVDPDQKLFEVTYGSSGSLRLEPGQELHLVLTNPQELEIAFNDQWETAMEIRSAIKRKRFRVMYEDRSAKKFMEIIRGG